VPKAVRQAGRAFAAACQASVCNSPTALEYRVGARVGVLATLGMEVGVALEGGVVVAVAVVVVAGATSQYLA
jgi:hypothetical protein